MKIIYRINLKKLNVCIVSQIFNSLQASLKMNFHSILDEYRDQDSASIYF